MAPIKLYILDGFSYSCSQDNLSPQCSNKCGTPRSRRCNRQLKATHHDFYYKENSDEKKKGIIMLIKTVIKRWQDFRPPGFFERKLLNEKLSCRQTSLNKFPTARNSCSLVRILNRK